MVQGEEKERTEEEDFEGLVGREGGGGRVGSSSFPSLQFVSCGGGGGGGLYFLDGQQRPFFPFHHLLIFFFWEGAGGTKGGFFKNGAPIMGARRYCSFFFDFDTERGGGEGRLRYPLFFFSPPQPPSRRLDPPSSLSNTTGWTLFEPDCCRDLLFRLFALRRPSSLF